VLCTEEDTPDFTQTKPTNVCPWATQLLLPTTPLEWYLHLYADASPFLPLWLRPSRRVPFWPSSVFAALALFTPFGESLRRFWVGLGPKFCASFFPYPLLLVLFFLQGCPSSPLPCRSRPNWRNHSRNSHVPQVSGLPPRPPFLLCSGLAKSQLPILVPFPCFRRPIPCPISIIRPGLQNICRVFS